ncbi:biliverdin-producing heme oxygenase [Halothiobacillus sp.]|uniref:biliverdin-producing heme oxygenase n=1 Tax=Halothiobacillus sp. TaxID=1891311 RepID=UPI002AD544C7|nr:biliverdin-producing heme oxygenase [Halothiobacillus sp.]
MRNIAHESPETSTALHVLRERTNSLHARLDSQSELAVLLEPGCSLADYQTATMSLAAAYRGVDSALAKGERYCPPALPAYIPRLPHLLADILLFGLTAPASPVFELSAPSSNASYLGMRYVIEGSNLGARVIYRSLQNSDIAQSIGVDKCYWSSAQTWQLSWPALLRKLAELRTHKEWDEAANSACLVFEHFIRFLTPEKRS